MTDSDRDLLERAARTAGAVHADSWDNGAMLVSFDGKKAALWNPLDDDGDALRLAVKLGIAIQYKRNAELELGLPRECAVAVTEDGEWFTEVGMDECAAARRAITRAAAEMAP